MFFFSSKKTILSLSVSVTRLYITPWQGLVSHKSLNCLVLAGGSTVGVNPKINNISGAYEASRYPLLLISDAGIFMKPETLTEMVSLMSPDVGIVQQLPFISDKKGWPATLEKVSTGGGYKKVQ